MITLKRMGVSGTPLFKKQIFTFEPGVTYVYGKNETRTHGKANSNASGKSRFFGYLSELLYDAPIVGLKQDRHKVGKRFIEYTYGDRHVKIMSSFSTRGKEKITIWVDGQQKTYLVPTKGKEAISKVFRPSASDFNAYVYLDSRVPHPLVRGDSMERKRFFTEFFGLNRIDAERKLFAAELSALMKVKAARDELQKSYESLMGDVLSKEEVTELKGKYTALKARIDTLRAKSERASEVRRITDFARSAEAQIKIVQEACKGNVSDEAFADALKAAKAAVRAAFKAVEEAREWETYRESMVAYKEATEGIEGSLDSADYLDGATKYSKAKSAKSYAERRLEELPEVKKPRTVPRPEGELDDLLATRARISQHLAHAEKFGEGVCSECGQAVETKDPKVLKKKLQGVVDGIESHKAYELYQEQLAEYKTFSAERATLEADLEKQTRLVTKYKSAASTYELLCDVSKPEPFKGTKRKLSEAERELEAAKEHLRALEFCQPNLDTIVEYLGLTEGDKTLLKFDSSRFLDLQERMAAIRAKLEIHSSIKGKVAEVKARLDELNEELTQEEPLRLLVKGYADKAMKKMAIEAICSHLMKVVNHYGQSYFPGFHFEFVWNTQLSIIAHRPNGEPSDVRKLSGAESLLFTLVLLMSLSSYVPSRKKVSVLILDEPSSSFSEETTKIFHEMLPELNRIFPSIVIITPKSEERYPGAHNYTVVRTKEGASIEEGLLV